MRIDVKFYERFKLSVLILLIAGLFPIYTAVSQPKVLNIKSNAVVKFDNVVVGINGSIDIGANANFVQNGVVSITGSWVNNGNQTSTMGSVTFLGTGTQYIQSISATSNQFYQIIINRILSSDTIIVDANVFSANTGFLTLQNGFFRFSGSNTFSNTFFNPLSAGNFEIPYNTGFILDNPNANVLAQSLEGSLFLRGVLQIIDGIFDIGSTGQSKLIYDDATPSELKIEGGELNIFTSLEPDNPSTDIIEFTQSSGTVTAGTGTTNSNNLRATFQISSGSQYDVSGGIIELNRASASNSVADFLVSATTGNVSGGTLLINAATAGQTFEVSSTRSIGNFNLAGTNNPIAKLTSNISVLTNVTLAGTGAGRFNMNNFALSLGGDWTNNLADANGFTPGDKAVLFNGSVSQNVQGTGDLIFGKFDVNKSGGKVEMTKPMLVNGDIKLISTQALIDMNSYNLTLGIGVNVYSDDGIDFSVDTFTPTKCIQNTGSDSDPLLGASLVRLINPSVTLPINLRFPVGTEGVSSSSEIILHSSGATFGANPSVSVKPVPQEHPEVETPSVSLTKYWAVGKNDVTVNSAGTTVYFYYDDSEVQGTEGSYRVLWYSPSYDNPAGFWRIDPGLNDDIVDFNQKFFYSVYASEISGDWVAGEAEAAAAIYYARQDGDYNTPSTWSKFGFNGPASATAPNKLSDKVRIQDHTITISAATAPANLLSIESGTEGRAPGKLVIQDNNYVSGDTLLLEANTLISLGHSDGLVIAPTASGAVRTSVRTFNSNVIYEYSGTDPQVSGNAIPNIVKCLRVAKPSGVILSLSKNVAISDSLVINDGILDVGPYSINGNSSNRLITMRGGELRLPTAFPSNYSTPTFTAGTINFNGIGNSTVPSSASTPAVSQYFNLKIAGTSRSGNVTFSNLGEIKISNTFDISEVEFTNNTYRFFTDASTFRFNKVGGTQDIPNRPALPADTVCYLSYYNLILDGAGTKQLSATGNPLFKVLNDITINNTADFTSNGFNLEVQNDWNNISGTFNPGTNYVIFRSTVANFTNNVTSRSLTDNPFYNVLIVGAGIVEPLDDMSITSDLVISSGSEFKLTDNNLYVKGNFTDQGGIFTAGTSSVYLNGTATQSVSRAIAGNLTFNNLIVDNTQNINASLVGTAGNGIIVNSNLTLQNGILRSHIGADYRFVSVAGTLSRPGGGYVDGELRKNVATGAVSKVYEVGYDKVYTPVTMDFTGTGGTAGYFGVLSDTLGVATSPISWSDATPSDIIPTGSSLNMARHNARQYSLNIPSGSSFVLGANREYNVTVSFVSGDIRNSADYAIFTGRLRSGSNWITPFYYGAKPVVGTRGATSFQFTQLKDFGTLVIGEPGLVVYYTRATGVWESATNWSTQGYGGLASITYPGQINNNYRVFIGNDNAITLNTNKTITNLTGENASVTLDSSGTMIMNQYTLGGNGDYFMRKNSTLSIGDAAGITASGATGNIINTGTRNFNVSSHNLGNFIYTGSGAQTSGNGLPSGTDSVLTLTINKTAGDLTLNATSNVTVKDSLNIQSGNLNSGSNDISLKGNLRINTGSSYTHNSRLFTFSGTKINQLVTAPAANLTFYRVFIDKNKDSSYVKFMPTASGNSYNITIDSLIFTANNKAFIDLSNSYTVAGYPDYNKGEWFITMYNNSTDGINRIGLGHIDGEVRKYVPINSLSGTGILYESGRSIFYRPFTIDLSNNGGTAGYMGVQNVEGVHPESSFLIDPNFNLPQERMLQIFWRLTRPAASSFAKSTARLMDLTVGYVNPDDIPDGALLYCFDLAYWKGSSSSDWQRLSPPSAGNNSGVGTNCGERDINFNEATYAPNATTISTEAYDITGTINLADYNLNLAQNNRFLLADVIIGQQGPSTTHFYSNKSGNWTDPTTWVTGSYGSGVNSNGSFPKERLHIAHIGENHKVTLDANIGNSYPDAGGTDEFREQRLGSVLLEKTTNGVGQIDLGTFVIRASVFQMQDECIIETGAEDGFHSSTYQGNIIQEYDAVPIARDFNYNSHNNGNFIFRPEGKITATHTNADGRYCQASIDASGEYITRVQQTGGADFSDNAQSTGGTRYFSYKVFTLTAGQTYTFRVYKSGGSSSYYGTIFIDTDFSGSYQSTAAERSSVLQINQSGNSYRDIDFTVPANTPQGTTQMRVVVRNSSSSIGDACNIGGNGEIGEIEDYTVYIVNPNATIIQQSGGAVPAQIATLKINESAAGGVVHQTSDISVKDYVEINAGQFSPQTSNLFVQGDLINNSGATGLDGSTGSVVFNGTTLSTVRGTSPSTSFFDIIGRKNNNIVSLEQNIFVNNVFQLDSNYNFVLNTANTLTFNEPASVSPGAGTYSKNKMIKVDGASNTSFVTKKFGAAIGPILSYCVPGLATNSQYINRVRFSDGVTFNNQVDVNSGYSDYTALVIPTITAGTAIRFRGYRNNNSNTRYWRVWVDLNQDSTFQDTEIISSGTTTDGTGTYSDPNFTIPITAYNGSTRMRVMMRNSNSNIDPCENTTLQSGEFEDYTVTINGATDNPGSGSGTVDVAFLFPIGTGNIYNPAEFYLGGTFGAAPSISVLLKEGLHPDRLTGNLFGDDILSKYWKVQTNDISDVVADSIKFGFDDLDVNGNEADYIPARYDGSWEINLGSLPKVEDHYIKIYPTAIDLLSLVDGDYLAGDPLAFFYGRKFYSIKTGNWNEHTSWSNVSHTGVRSQYFPGDIFFQDTVLIDGFTITFQDSSHILIDSLRIGGTDATNGGVPGVLTFGVVPTNKTLDLRQLTTSDNGLINSAIASNRQDTIRIKKDFESNSSATQTLWYSNSLVTHLIFDGTDSSKFAGTGTIGNLGTITLDKTGELLDTLYISATQFPAASLASTNLLFRPLNGIIKFNNGGTNYLSSDLAATEILFEPGSGLYLQGGEVRSRTVLS